MLSSTVSPVSASRVLCWTSWRRIEVISAYEHCDLIEKVWAVLRIKVQIWSRFWWWHSSEFETRGTILSAMSTSNTFFIALKTYTSKYRASKTKIWYIISNTWRKMHEQSTIGENIQNKQVRARSRYITLSGECKSTWWINGSPGRL